MGTDVQHIAITCGNSQPFVLCLGKRGFLEKIFLVAEDLAVETPSIVSAVDKGFKLGYIASKAYDSKVEHVWQFMQKVVCKIHDDTNKFTCVYDLQDFLKRTAKKSVVK